MQKFEGQICPNAKKEQNTVFTLKIKYDILNTNMKSGIKSSVSILKRYESFLKKLHAFFYRIMCEKPVSLAIGISEFPVDS